MAGLRRRLAWNVSLVLCPGARAGAAAPAFAAAVLTLVGMFSATLVVLVIVGVLFASRRTRDDLRTLMAAPSRSPGTLAER